MGTEQSQRDSLLSHISSSQQSREFCIAPLSFPCLASCILQNCVMATVSSVEESLNVLIAAAFYKYSVWSLDKKLTLCYCDS